MAEVEQETIKTQVLELVGEMDELDEQEVLNRLGEIYDFWFLPWGRRE